jgi:hypothetical protein
MSDYFDLLENELRAAVPRAVTAGAPVRALAPFRAPNPAATRVPSTRRSVQLRPGVLPAAIGVAATLLVVGLALVTLGHAGKTRSLAKPARQTPATTGTPVRPSTTPAPRPARDRLSDQGIGNLDFGRPRAAAVAALDRLLGVPGSHPMSYRGDCGLGKSLTWSDPSSPSGQPALTAYFAHDRLVGYQYGDPGSQIVRRLPARGVVLATTRGLTVGDTLGKGRRLYGGAFKISTAQGGSWKVTTATGSIDGYASGVPRPGTTNALKVLTIDAGNVGCAAVSP